MGILLCRRHRVFENIRFSRILAAGIRTMSSTSVVSSFGSVPLLMTQTGCCALGRFVIRCHSPANNDFYTLFSNRYCRRGGTWKDIKDCNGEIVSSSQGWLGLQRRKDHQSFLIDPVADRAIKLPQIATDIHRLIVAEKARFVVAVQGPAGRLGFCSPLRSAAAAAWTYLPSERACDSLTYSNRHNRLFCITRNPESYTNNNNKNNNKMNFEVWDLGEREGEAPKLELEFGFNVDTYRPEQKKLKYLVCAEHSGEVFLVVRYVKICARCGGSFVDGIVHTEYVYAEDGRYGRGYKTCNFKVYKVDLEGRRLLLMKRSLEGMAMFVGGQNEGVAIPVAEAEAEGGGLKPDSIYFTYDKRIRYMDGRLTEYRYRAEDNNIFNYVKKGFSGYLCYPNIYAPMWYSPSPSPSHI